MLKRFIASSLLMILVTASLMAVSAPVSAVDIFKNCTQTSTTAAEKAQCNDCASAVASQSDYCVEAKNQTDNPIIHIITIIINIVSFIGGAAAIIGLIVCGLRLVLSSGDSNAVTQARNGIIYSLIGIVVIVFAQIIVAFVLNKVK